MSEVAKAKEAVDGAKEVVATSGDVVDKVFSNLDSYFKTIADTLTSDQAEEFGKKVIDTGLTVVQVDSIIYVGTWLSSLVVLSALVYLFYRILFEKTTPLVGEAREVAVKREQELTKMGWGSRNSSQDRELSRLTKQLSCTSNKISMAEEDWRQGLGGIGLVVSSVVLGIVVLTGFNAWKFVAIFEPELYVVKIAVDKILN